MTTLPVLRPATPGDKKRGPKIDRKELEEGNGLVLGALLRSRDISARLLIVLFG
jgi:hypothetical protein